MFSTSTKSALSKFFFLCFVIFGSYAVPAQVTQNGRAEIGISSSMESYSVVSLDTAGIILYRSFIGPKENQLELIRLDTALHNVWQGFLSMPKGLSLVSAKTTANRIYFFLEGKTTDKHIFQAFAVQIKDGSYLS